MCDCNGCRKEDDNGILPSDEDYRFALFFCLIIFLLGAAFGSTLTLYLL